MPADVVVGHLHRVSKGAGESVGHAHFSPPCFGSPRFERHSFPLCFRTCEPPDILSIHRRPPVRQGHKRHTVPSSSVCDGHRPARVLAASVNSLPRQVICRTGAFCCGAVPAQFSCCFLAASTCRIMSRCAVCPSLLLGLRIKRKKQITALSCQINCLIRFFVHGAPRVLCRPPALIGLLTDRPAPPESNMALACAAEPPTRCGITERKRWYRPRLPCASMARRIVSA